MEGILLHGTQWEYCQEAIQQGWLSEPKAAFLLNRHELAQRDQRLVFTLAVACFHAVGLAGWHTLVEAYQAGRSVYGSLAFLFFETEDTWGFSGSLLQHYESLDFPGRKIITFNYLRARDCGPIPLKKSQAWIWPLPLDEIRQMIRPGDVKCVGRFFQKPTHVQTLLVPLETRIICENVALRLLRSTKSIESLVPSSSGENVYDGALAWC